MLAGELVTCLMEKASLQAGQLAWAVFEVVASGELGNDAYYDWFSVLIVVVVCCVTGEVKIYV